MTQRQCAIRMRTVRGEFTHRTATPEGGARRRLTARVRGCVAAALCFAAISVSAQTVPSGQMVELTEVLIDQVGADATLRFRFLAPDIAGRDVDIEAALTDMTALCEEVARPYLAEQALDADVVVITLMDRPVPFGTTDPDATQLFEAFRLAGGSCELESF